MRKLFTFVCFVTVIATSYAQELTGVWLSTIADKNDTGAIFTNRNQAILLNFDDNLYGDIETNTFFKITPKFKKSKIKAKHVKGKLDYLRLSENELNVKDAKGNRIGFKKLYFSYPIEMAEIDIIDFIKDQQCGPVNEVDFTFSVKRFSSNSTLAKENNKRQLINTKTKEIGYWFVRKIKGNAFIVFSTPKSSVENIYQISSLSLYGLKLIALQEDKVMSGLDLIGICL